MSKKIRPVIIAKLARFVTEKLPSIKDAVSRFLGRTNRRVLFDFLILIMILSSIGKSALFSFHLASVMLRDLFSIVVQH